MQATVHVWRSKGNLWESFLPFQTWNLGHQAWQETPFNHWAILPASWQFILMIEQEASKVSVRHSFTILSTKILP